MRHAAICITILLLCLASPIRALAQSGDVVVALATDQNSFYAGDATIVHVIVLNAENASQPVLEPPPGLTIEALPRQDSSSSFVSIVNGRRTERREVRYLYPFRVTAATPGRYTLGPARVTVDGHDHITEAITLLVRDPQQRDDMRLVLSLDKSAAYVGEPVTLTVTWMIRNNVRGFDFSEPDLAPDFEVYDTPAPAPTARDIRDQRYFEVDFLGSTVLAERGTTLHNDQTWTTLTLHKTLIPQRAGEIEIGPLIVRCDVQTGRGRPGLFGDQGVFERAVAPSNTTSLTVLPLPPGQPPEFTGLVGAYQVSARLAQARMKVGDPVKLTVRVSGTHPIERAANVDLLRHSSLNRYFQIAYDDVSSHIEGGSLLLETTVRPLSEHVTELPAFRIHYFDPEIGEFRMAQSEPQRLTVEPTRVVTVADALGGESPASAAIESVAGGLAHIYTTDDVLIDQRLDLDALVRSPVVIASVVAPPAIWAAAAIALAARRHVRRDARRSTQRGAASKAKQNLRAAASVEHIGAAMRTYLKHRLDAPTNASPTEAEAAILPINADAAARLRALLTRIDEAQFAGAGAYSAEECRAEAESIVNAIENAAGKGAR